jgi:hypothetical protein
MEGRVALEVRRIREQKERTGELHEALWFSLFPSGSPES